MSIEIKIPDIGTNELKVTKIMVKVGDKISINQLLITIEGQNIFMEIPSPNSGIVKEIKVIVDEIVVTGKTFIILEAIERISEFKSDMNITSYVHSKINRPDIKDIDHKNIELKQVVVPDIGDDEFEVTDLMVNIGDQVLLEQPIITVEGEKTSVEIPAPFAGEVKEIKIVKGSKVKTGSLIMIFATKANLDLSNNSSKIDISNKSETKFDESISLLSTTKNSNFFNIKNDTHVHATPLVRRLAYEFGIDLANIIGTGPKGRILREDIKNYIKKSIRQIEDKVIAVNDFRNVYPLPKIDFSRFGEIEEVELTRIQKISSSNLSRNWITIPHVTIMEDADITEVEAFRKQQNKEMEKLKIEVKITPLVFVMKAIAKALEEMPRFNSSISLDTQRLILKKYIHIGIAVDTSNGLVVPVIRDVNKKSIVNLSKELMEISKKARFGKLTPYDVQGGSFTISSLGNIGTTSFTPIINAPEVAILGISRSSMKLVWDGNKFISRLILPISLSFNHCVIDGADGARFISRVAQLISDIRRLII